MVTFLATKRQGHRAAFTPLRRRHPERRDGHSKMKTIAALISWAYLHQPFPPIGR